MNYAYVLRCADGTLYTGWTNNLEKRLIAHCNGTGGKYTRSRLPVELVYSEKFDEKQDAQRREYAIKQMSRQEKERLVAGQNNSDNVIVCLYDTLLAHYGNLHWWPAKTPYEVMVGAVLTQNTAWSNVEKAIANFGGDLTPEFLTDIDSAALVEIIRPAGFFNQKAAYLKAMTAWYAQYGFDVETAKREPLAKLRAELLSVKGIGQETADSILLYAFGFPTFVVDAYTNRLCERYPIKAGDNYADVKAYFEENIPQSAEIFNSFHALIVINAKEHCRKKPLCEGCPLRYSCGRHGV